MTHYDQNDWQKQLKGEWSIGLMVSETLAHGREGVVLRLQWWHHVMEESYFYRGWSEAEDGVRTKDHATSSEGQPIEPSFHQLCPTPWGFHSLQARETVFKPSLQGRGGGTFHIRIITPQRVGEMSQWVSIFLILLSSEENKTLPSWPSTTEQYPCLNIISKFLLFSASFYF